MNIFELALRMEKEAGDYYRAHAESNYSEGIQGTFRFLADEEDRHYRLVNELYERLLSEGRTRFIDARGLLDALLLDSREHVFGGSIVAVYNYAIEMEKASMQVYMELTRDVEDAERIDLLTMLAREEARHIELLDDLLEITRKPEEWVENPEFSHIGEEY